MKPSGRARPAPAGALSGPALALGAALLFGAAAPLCKLLLPGAHPLALSALLYLGGGAALLALPLLSRPAAARSKAPEARLRRADAPALAAVAVLGGVLGPLLLLTGLQRVSGTVGSLLLNLEAPLTVLVAVAFFGEHLGRTGAAAAALIVAGSALLGLGPAAGRASPEGLALVALACAAWALDNNLSARLSLRDPVAVARVKALAAGGFALALSRALGQPLPSPRTAIWALLAGAISIGVSLVLSLRAQRVLGAARQALWFASAPFAGALLAVPILGERPRAQDALAAAAMAAGLLLLRRERHDHLHAHAALEHDHLHVHDEHHRHTHDGPAEEPHAHPHRHEPLEHAHPHLPDAHHRHGHR